MHALTRSALFGISALVLTSRLAATQQPQDEIRAEIDRFVAAVNRNDPKGWAELYDKKPGVASLGDGDMRRGWPAIAAMFDTLSRRGAMQLRLDPVEIVMLSDNSALAYGRYRWTLGTSNQQTVVGVITFVYRRSDDIWRLVHDHTSNIAAP